ncbi:AraC family transcriptional regulator [Sphingomonas sp. Leaf33]|uniref:helix-turn-helix domain-containing protein n=1 Tax=Sphingomonas sp. Leaf33 TaxID=1736215 RepID=UPI00070150F5|nr:AraC family transcriptional regulator [Sphingomonas sp. Leaf33]KQN26789.1 AraC family transcriptional regulator [Sphingomonas sp. Leaf33]
MKVKIEVSGEMLAFVGDGAVAAEGWPDDPIGLAFRLGDGTVSIDPHPLDSDALADADVVLIVTAPACRRLFALAPDVSGDWHLPSDIRLIALAIRDCPLAEPVRTTLRLAKSIELLCATFDRLGTGALVPVDGARILSALDAERIAAARRMIDDRWNQKLTLDDIARACGINRAKLTRGFRAMFDCTIADAIAERRLGGARSMLLTTDLPVSSVGFACGYLNNAAFTRAFSRRFGLAPTQLRAAA